LVVQPVINQEVFSILTSTEDKHSHLNPASQEGAPRQNTPQNGAPPSTDNSNRVRIDGKFLMRNGRRWRVQGVTYGPFAPNAQNEPFPSPQTVRTDFKRMQEAGVNAIRTYHFPLA
jgi:hypothetical protein